MPTRRTVVALIGSVGLAGCNGVLGGTNDGGPAEESFAVTETQTGTETLVRTETSTETATPTETGPTPVEDFESGDLSAYEGDLDGFYVTTDESYEGTATLVADNPTGESYDMYRYSGPTPSAGDRFRFNLNLGNGGGEGAGLRFYFGTQDSEQHFAVQVERGDMRGITLRKDDEPISNDPADIPRNRWLEVEVNWQRGDPTTAQVYDPEHPERVYATTAAELSDYKGGGIGWRALDSTAQPRYADAVRIVNGEE